MAKKKYIRHSDRHLYGFGDKLDNFLTKNASGSDIKDINSGIDALTGLAKGSDATSDAIYRAMGIPSTMYGIGGMLSTVGTEIAKDVQVAKGKDLSQYENMAKMVENNQINVASSADLLNAATNRTQLNNLTMKDVTGKSGAQRFLGAAADAAGSFAKGYMMMTPGLGGIGKKAYGGPILIYEDPHKKNMGGLIAGGVMAAANIGANIIGEHKTRENLDNLNNSIDVANVRQDRAVSDASTNFMKNKVGDFLASYYSFGGPMFGYPNVSGALEYDMAKDELYNKQLSAQSKLNSGNAFSAPLSTFAEGGSIHIKPSKKGTFTAAASKHGMGVQEFASKVLANKEDYSPEMVKKANFARNAAHWNALGGDLGFPIFSNGVTLINSGGTHENNPHEGVPAGIAPDGKPNLVEEGEVIYEGYLPAGIVSYGNNTFAGGGEMEKTSFVFSNRLRVPEEVRQKYKLRGPKNMTFAEAFRRAQKESEERPNDPISKDGLENIAMILARTQEAVKGYEKAKGRGEHMAALGGHLHAIEGPLYNLNFLQSNDSFTASNNKNLLPYNRKMNRQAIIDYENTDAYRNFTDYIYNNWEDANVQEYLKQLDALTGHSNINRGRDYFKQMRNDHKYGYYHLTPEDISGMLLPEVTVTATKSAAPAAETAPATTAPIVEEVLEGTDEGNADGVVPDPAELKRKYEASLANSQQDPNTSKTPWYNGIFGDINGNDILRMAPIFANAGAVASDMIGLTNTPTKFNYIPAYQAIGFNPLGNYIAPYSMDTRYAMNQNNAQAAATRNAIMQSAAPSRNAGLLAADYNAQIANGDLYYKARLQDFANELQRQQFNRGTDQYNSEGNLKTDMFNAENRLRYANAALQQAQMNDHGETMAYMGRAQNLKNLTEDLAEFARERDAKDWRSWLVSSSGRGLDLDGIRLNIVPSKQYEFAKSLGYTDDEIKAAGIKSAKGGKIRRKKKGLTY